MGWKKIVFDKERITYRNDDEDINVYVYKNTEHAMGYGKFRSYATGAGDTYIATIENGTDSFSKANSKALAWIRKHPRGIYNGTEGQDRKSYTDKQDRRNYT